MKNIRVLIVDDEEDSRQMFSDLLEVIGHESDAVESFKDAKALLARSRYDLTLLDIDLDGSTTHLAFQMVCRFLQQQYPELPIVATSGLQIHPRFMWKLCKLGVVGFVFKGEISVDEFQKSIEDAMSSDQAPAPMEFRDAHALLVGVGQYISPSFPDLPAPKCDVQAIEAVLSDRRRCGYSARNVTRITDQEATANDIRAALADLARSAGPESTVFVFFSGHGGRVAESRVWRTYLCPHEADLRDLEATAIGGEEFRSLLANISARKLLVVLDACHAAGAADLKSGGEAAAWNASLPNAYVETLSQGSGRVVIASSKEDQKSYLHPEADLSLFTWHFVEGLKGAAAVREDGVVRILDLYHYVSHQVKAERPSQEPILNAKEMDDNFPIALAAI